MFCCHTVSELSLFLQPVSCLSFLLAVYPALDKGNILKDFTDHIPPSYRYLTEYYRAVNTFPVCYERKRYYSCQAANSSLHKRKNASYAKALRVLVKLLRERIVKMLLQSLLDRL